MTDVTDKLARVAVWLRRHPDVHAGPSVRAMIAAGRVHAALQAVAGQDDLLRSALLTLPHRLRVRAGADAEQLVRDAVHAATSGGDAEPDSGEHQPERLPDQAPTRARRAVFSLTGEDPGRRVEGVRASPLVDDKQATTLLDDLLRPAAWPLVSDGSAAALASRSSTSDRLAPETRRPGDRSADLSLRATVRAAARSGRGLSEELRVQRRRPTTSLDVALALDASGSMLGAATTGLAQALAVSLTRAGHRVALLVFADTVTQVCPFTRNPHAVLTAAAEYDPAYPTDLELVLHTGRELLLRAASATRGRRLLLVTDAEPTVCGHGSPAGRFGAAAARAAGLQAAVRCKRDGISVSLLCPPPGAVAHVDLGYAARLAAAGGGRVRCYPDRSDRQSEMRRKETV